METIIFITTLALWFYIGYITNNIIRLIKENKNVRVFQDTVA